MTRIRLRDARAAEAERELYSRTYPEGYRHDVWPDHVERVAASVKLISRYRREILTLADLSCGDGAIARGLFDGMHLDKAYLGDLNLSPVLYGIPQAAVLAPGPLPESLDQLPEQVDLFVLSETIEHMDDPDDLLRRLPLYARYLFLSTPISEIPTSGNLEHYWSWSTDDVAAMLRDTGWHPVELVRLVPESTRTLEHAYHYQLWMAVAHG